MASIWDDFSGFVKSPEGVGVMSAIAGGLAGARRGAPLNSIGKAGMSGLLGFSNAQEAQDKQQTNDLMRKYHTTQMDQMNLSIEQARRRAEEMQNLPEGERQMMAMGVSPDKIFELREQRNYDANRPSSGTQSQPLPLPQLGAQQGQGAYRLNTETPDQQADIQRQLVWLEKNDPATHKQVLSALVKQGAIEPPTAQVIPNALQLAEYAVRGQRMGVKGAQGDYNLAKDFYKPDWQQIDNGGQIQFVNKNSGQMPTITKTDTPELSWQKDKFGREQTGESAKLNVSREAELRKEFAGLQTTQDFWNIQPVLQTAREASKVDNKAADLNLIYSVAKLYDPGSVVREGETAMHAASGSPAEQFVGLFNSIAGGARLTLDQRNKIMEQVESRARGYEDAHNTRADQYKEIAGRYGIDPQNIITIPPNKAVRGATSDTRRKSVLPGQVIDGYRFKGGNPADPKSWEQK